MYTENWKSLVKGIKEDLNNWKDIPHLQTRRLNIVTIALLPKLIYQWNAKVIKIQVGFCGYCQTDSKVQLEIKEHRVFKIMLKKMNKFVHFPISKLTTNIQHSKESGTSLRRDM